MLFKRLLLQNPAIAGVAVVLTAAVSTGLRAQQDRIASPGATIRGSVLSEAGAPVAGVTVVVFPALPARWTGADKNAIQIGDASRGNFAFTQVPPGQYILGVVPNGVELGPELFKRLADSRQWPAVPISSGQTVEFTITIAPAESGYRLLRAQVSQTSVVAGPRGAPPFGGPGQPARPPSTAPGSITGRVTDADGKPLAGIEVRSLRPVTLGGVSQLASFGDSAITAADGTYRLANRPAAVYLIAAFPFANDRASAQMLTTRTAPASSPDSNGQLLGYVITFYPGVAIERQGTLVPVQTSEVPAIDIQLVRKPVFTITGKITDGIPVLRPAVIAVVPSNVREQMAGLHSSRVQLAGDGSFSVPDLPNGQYVVAYTGPTAWARREIEINGRSPEPVTLELQKPITVSGKVEFAGTAALPAVSNTPTARPLLYAELAPTQMITGTILLPRPIQANAFSTQGSGPGPFMLRAGAPAPWIQVSGLVNGIDTLDLPLPANASFEDALIVFADRPNLLVNVKDANGSPVTNATVAVFTEDVRYWGTRSRRAQLMAVTPVGTATFSGLPPAKYLVAAVTDVPANRVVSASLLATLKPLALPVEIAIGESRSINLTIK